ncbi:hypothetical protein KVR01_012944 [Diaporthe batatas]|uniref:uncharacterized protein n=1 Tax=Diaporthe batatas TaxID=748121 RepID=UPI001D04678E|nr:uncharacterized protein KVR01_012944 [Diaporthe batatas]KAG8157236.1 hypothetical protein KVR01_012944 [Diaporthe batatas]
MSSSQQNILSGLALRPKPSNAPPESDKNQAKNETTILLRKSDTEGWSEEKLTMALNDHAAKSQPPTDTPPVAPAQAESQGQPKVTSYERVRRLARWQETVLLLRQAEMEGWSDEKLTRMLRTRAELRQEILRTRANSA